VHENAFGTTTDNRVHFCSTCGTPVGSADAFCSSCGQRVVDVAQAGAAWLPVPRQPDALAAPQAAVARPAPIALLPHGWEPASFAQRLGARVLDGIVIVVISLLAYLVWALVASNVDLESAGLGYAVGALLLFLLIPTLVQTIYRVGSDVGSGRSLGRAAVGIRLVKLPRIQPEVQLAPEDELARIGLGSVLGRLFVAGLGDCLFLLNSLSVLWDPQRRSWADHASNSAVVVDRHGEKRSASIAPLAALTVAVASCLALVLLAPVGTGGTSTLSTVGDSTSRYYPTDSTSDKTSTGTTTTGSGNGSTGTGSTGTGSGGSADASTSYPITSDLYVRSGPSSATSQLSLLTAGTRVTIDCQTEGEYIVRPTGASAIWDRISYPVDGWVSDEFVSTGTTGTNARIASSC
jgi:uncharacterized RDD family membrane protein YckC